MGEYPKYQKRRAISGSYHYVHLFGEGEFAGFRLRFDRVALLGRLGLAAGR